jgi:hypothetical protein
VKTDIFSAYIISCGNIERELLLVSADRVLLPSAVWDDTIKKMLE